MPIQNTRSINGANALIKVSVGGVSKIVGYATGVTVTEAYVLNRIDVLGLIDTVDIEPIGRTVSGTISIMRMTSMTGDDQFNGGGAAFQGILPTSTETDVTAPGRTQSVMDFMNNGFDLIIEDSADFAVGGQQVRYEVKGCRPSTHSFALSRGAIMGVDVAFEALMLVESDAATPTAAG